MPSLIAACLSQWVSVQSIYIAHNRAVTLYENHNGDNATWHGPLCDDTPGAHHTVCIPPPCHTHHIREWAHSHADLEITSLDYQAAGVHGLHQLMAVTSLDLTAYDVHQSIETVVLRQTRHDVANANGNIAHAEHYTMFPAKAWLSLISQVCA